ncbi:MAG: monooxygenase [Candidatus Azotimanducaceae bacterium]|jgi:monooxygenase
MTSTQHFDVIIVGAGLSGIGAAVHIQKHCPDKTFAILESRAKIGGTWDLFRYPGIRSDSDMHTLGYSFKPWTEAKSIADGPSIRNYVNEAAKENDINRHIRFNSKVQSAHWSTPDARWEIETSDENGETSKVSANFLFMCGGYYNYDQPHDPKFEGVDDFKGQVLHPQFWPEELDYAGKKIIVIGSGATAMTMVPAMAKTAQSVTMVQRSPTYVVSAPGQDKIANRLRKILPDSWAYALTRLKNTTLQNFFYNKTRKEPEETKQRLLKMMAEHLDQETIDKHFTPTYNPWDQRLCLIPDADLYKSINTGKANVVTEHIDRFTDKGLLLKDGSELEADIIVTATGLEMTVLSNVEFVVDNEKINFPDKFSYKGMLFSDIPNLAQTFGYINASWTLRADLTSEYVCRVLNHMDELGVQQVTPRLRPEDENMPARPWIDGFSAGYMQRSMHLFMKQGEGPWRNTQNYALDKKMIRKAPLEDGALVFDNPKQSSKAA